MTRLIMRAAGADGVIELLDDRIVIQRTGLLNAAKYGINMRREMPLATITSVHFRDATFFKRGEIDFDYAGRSQTDRSQNKVLFTQKHQEAFFRLKEKVFELMQNNRR